MPRSDSLYPYQRRMVDRLLSHHRPQDSIRLRLPWGDERNFLVPAADRQNPVFEYVARGAINDAARHGVGVVEVMPIPADATITPDFLDEVRHVALADYLALPTARGGREPK